MAQLGRRKWIIASKAPMWETKAWMGTTFNAYWLGLMSYEPDDSIWFAMAQPRLSRLLFVVTYVLKHTVPWRMLTVYSAS